MDRASGPSNEAGFGAACSIDAEIGRAIVGNEFASVEVVVVRSERVVRLVLRDVASGRTREIDPLVLEALVFMSDEEMERLADPNLVVDDDS